MSYMAPVPDEIDAHDLPVSGALPPELTGRYFRNGPNPLPGERPGHWFNGHGMLHGVRLRDGRAEWYRNRWVRTGKLAGLPYVRADGGRELTAVSANTHVIEHAGRILALVENGLPYQITPDLDTVGALDFHGRLTTAMTAHPKQDPVTGDLHFFGYGVRPPYLTYHRLDASGALVHSREVTVPGGTMMHDFAITEHHVVWLDLPVTFQPQLVGKTMPYRWDDAYGARLGVMRHDQPDAPVRWFDIEPCYVFHVGNAHEDAFERIVLHAVRYSPADFTAVWRMAGGGADPAGPAAAAAAAPDGTARLHRWTLDPTAGTITEQALDDRAIEFPTLDDDRIGRAARYLYTSDDSAIVKYDLTSGGTSSHRLKPGTVIGEAVFVPATSGPRGEDDGWLLSITTRQDGSASQLLVLDASDLAARPVAAIDLPRAVPAGFHGSWIADRPAP
ncbi:carotenoid oxygenase family protein [Streptosporangium sp. NBC_01756]|uniref:carotenoid oxygenase family protein n=1 Tax=Streptosporangium sp. NBC_01756 TaxID=2975950 RepID=UPI002DDBC408|nr:carotenoid oxygenase family protein [Streptosporangium sp. NBC_01756]WSC88978.1 carotenoid oxygenase family protein [Streptosporangium sp. NBC_01756]